MRYLDDEHIEQLGVDWIAVTDAVRRALALLGAGDATQPMKPYLRYGDSRNRIIAMPAYVGGSIAMAGIKWIASFPQNYHKGLPRAHSVTVLNEADTGVPRGALAATRLSTIRTAAVTALMLKAGLPRREGPLRFGMTGYGPVGQAHAQMLASLFGDRIERLRVFDPRPIRPEVLRRHDWIEVVNRWEEAYEADVFITCTIAAARYVNRPPVPGSLQLNISLRDYDSAVFQHVRYVVVDSWEEVCRENTDIHQRHMEGDLDESDTLSLGRVVLEEAIADRNASDVVMFNPMGLAIFDVAVAAHYLERAEAEGVGIDLSRSKRRDLINDREGHR